MTLKNTNFLDACKKKSVEYTPIWFMRQAGRYLSSYRKLKGNLQVTELSKNCELASEVAVDAVNQLGVDAAIMFGDIMLPLEGLGIDFNIVENVGPVISKPIKNLEDVQSLEFFEPEKDIGYIKENIETTLQKLDDRVPLIGFSGAPFTLASYIIEGMASKDLVNTKSIMFNHPDVWNLLMEKLTKMVADYLCFQIKSGVHAIQIFDSWAGCLCPADYEKYVLKFTKKVFSKLKDVPKIHFCANSACLIEKFCELDADVLSVDWRVSIGEVYKIGRGKIGVQGNLDPASALAGGNQMENRIKNILGETEQINGHIFSLGHGVLKQTPPENLKSIVKFVHEITINNR